LDSEEARDYYFQSNVLTTDQFIGLGLMGSNATLERITDSFSFLCKNSTDFVVEWMCHPGYAQMDGEGDVFSRSQDREFEMNNLNSKHLKQMLKKQNIQLTSWTQLYSV